MSCEKVKRISVNRKDGLINITSACNNLRPLTFETWQFKHTSMGDQVHKVCNALLMGDLQCYNGVLKEGFIKYLKGAYTIYDNEYISPYSTQDKDERERIHIKNKTLTETIVSSLAVKFKEIYKIG